MNKNQKIFKLGYNTSYNRDYNQKIITYSQHLLDKMASRRLSLEKIEETIKTGKPDIKKSKSPKLCLTRYYGKENISYYVVILENEDFIEVITTWKKKGK